MDEDVDNRGAPVSSVIEKTDPNVSTSKDDRREGYFQSREVYRGRQGNILVDAFQILPNRPVSFAESLSPRPSLTQPSGTSGAAPPNDCAALPQRPARTFYFLSHFHSDHYAGITNRWCRGLIYCSRPTAALTESTLRVAPSFLFPMELDRTYTFSFSTGVCLSCVPETPHHPRVQSILHPHRRTSPMDAVADGDDVFAVRLIPANHCPGAVMFLFVSAAMGTVLHTGDFRFNGAAKATFTPGLGLGKVNTRPSPVLLPQPSPNCEGTAAAGSKQVGHPVPFYEQLIADDLALQEVAKQELLDVLYLDNTFCAPTYKFPMQREVTRTVVEVLHSLFRSAAAHPALETEKSTSSVTQRRVRCAVLVGCYTIGKERIALALREAFPAAPPKRKTAPLENVSSPAEVEAAKEATAMPWRIHVSPSRYRLLSAMQFFPEAFQSLLSCKSDGTSNGTSGEVGFAVVADAAVQLPVAHHREGAAESYSDCSVQNQSDDGSAPTAANRHSVLGNSSSSIPVRDRQDTADVENFLSVFLVSMGSVHYRAAAALAQAGEAAHVFVDDGLAVNLGRYDKVLLVEPTGWCKRHSVRNISEKYTLLCVPYSEHCGFQELLQFVEFVNPARIVPTVSAESFKRYESLFVERASRLRSRVSNVQPITRFFSRSSPTSAAYASHDAGRVERGTEAAKRPRRHLSTELAESSSPSTAMIADTVAELSTKSHLLERTRPTHGLLTASSTTVTAVAHPTCTTTKRWMWDKKVIGEADAAPVTSPAPANCPNARQLFRKVEMGRQRLDSSRFEGKVMSDNDEDCQVVRVRQPIVDISDDSDG